MNLLLHGGLMFFGNADGQGKLFHGGVMVFKELNPMPPSGGGGSGVDSDPYRDSRANFRLGLW